MKLFEGLPATDYQDVLRALGRFIDEHRYQDIRILETEDGLIFQGRASPRTGRPRPVPQFDTFLITDDDLREMLRGAYELRGRGEMLPRP